tara:strand:- start:52 stop:195 length:144 start_codon:yes stop_codon:yes gene_type:complete
MDYFVRNLYENAYFLIKFCAIAHLHNFDFFEYLKFQKNHKNSKNESN